MMKKWGAALILFLAGSLALPAAWTTKRLTSSPGHSAFPDVAVNGANIYTVWADDTPGTYEVYFRKSTNGGMTWQAARKLTNASHDSDYPRLAVSGLNVFVVWRDKAPDSAGIGFMKSNDGGQTWQALQTLTSAKGDSGWPWIAVSGMNVYAAWHTQASGHREIYFRRSTDGGATWQTAQRLTKNGRDSINPSLAVGGSNLNLVWQEVVSANYEIYFMKSADGGATWQAARRLTQNPQNSIYPRVAASGSRIYVAWHDFSTGNDEIYFLASADGGATWQPFQMLTHNKGHSFIPDIAVSGSNVYVVWEDDTPGNYEIYLRKSADQGATWQAPLRLTTNAGSSFNPALAIGRSKIYVVWEDATPGNYEIYLKSSPVF
jgi:hypothetical protein